MKCACSYLKQQEPLLTALFLSFLYLVITMSCQCHFRHFSYFMTSLHLHYHHHTQLMGISYLDSPMVTFQVVCLCIPAIVIFLKKKTKMIIFVATTCLRPFSDFLLHQEEGQILSMATWRSQGSAWSHPATFSSLISLLLYSYFLNSQKNASSYHWSFAYTICFFFLMWGISPNPSTLISEVTTKGKLHSTQSLSGRFFVVVVRSYEINLN